MKYMYMLDFLLQYENVYSMCTRMCDEYVMTPLQLFQTYAHICIMSVNISRPPDTAFHVYVYNDDSRSIATNANRFVLVQSCV